MQKEMGYYYRVGLVIDTNMFYQAFHSVFKYTYLNGKANKRVDKCLVNLIKFTEIKHLRELRN